LASFIKVNAIKSKDGKDLFKDRNELINMILTLRLPAGRQVLCSFLSTLLLKR
jgi:hypothetical protein